MVAAEAKSADASILELMNPTPTFCAESEARIHKLIGCDGLINLTAAFAYCAMTDHLIGPPDSTSGQFNGFLTTNLGKINRNVYLY